MKRLLTHSNTGRGGGNRKKYPMHVITTTVNISALGYLSGENTMESLFKFLQQEAKTTKCDILHSSSDLFLRTVESKYMQSYISSERKSTLQI